MKVYVKYDRRKPHLPVAIADSKEELADMIGTSLNTVASGLSHGIGTYAAVEIDEHDWFPTNDGGLWAYDNSGGVIYAE